MAISVLCLYFLQYLDIMKEKIHVCLVFNEYILVFIGAVIEKKQEMGAENSYCKPP